MRVFESLKDIINNIKNGNKRIPDAYSQFPMFEGNITNLSERKEEKYTRCTMDYKNVSEEEFNNYILKVESLGYIKASKVKYEKENTYIIIERNSNMLHLVFHIKR